MVKLWQALCDSARMLNDLGQPYGPDSLADWWSSAWYEIKSAFQSDEDDKGGGNAVIDIAS